VRTCETCDAICKKCLALKTCTVCGPGHTLDNVTCKMLVQNYETKINFDMVSVNDLSGFRTDGLKYKLLVDGKFASDANMTVSADTVVTTTKTVSSSIATDAFKKATATAANVAESLVTVTPARRLTVGVRSTTDLRIEVALQGESIEKTKNVFTAVGNDTALSAAVKADTGEDAQLTTKVPAAANIKFKVLVKTVAKPTKMIDTSTVKTSVASSLGVDESASMVGAVDVVYTSPADSEDDSGHGDGEDSGNGGSEEENSSAADGVPPHVHRNVDDTSPADSEDDSGHGDGEDSGNGGLEEEDSSALYVGVHVSVGLTAAWLLGASASA